MTGMGLFWHKTKMLIRWLPIVWDDADFDWDYLARIMEVKLRWMSKQADECWRGIDGKKHARDMLICAELLKRLRADEMDDLGSIDSRTVKIHDARMKGWEEMLSTMFFKKMRGWWD